MTIPKLHYWFSEPNRYTKKARYLFIRLDEEDKNDPNLVMLWRILEKHEIDVEHALRKFERIRAMILPAWMYDILDTHYNMSEVTEIDFDYLGVS